MKQEMILVFILIMHGIKDKKIIIKRNQDNFPIIRYSLFDNKNFTPNKTSIKKINNLDLSKLNDTELKNLHI